jgi:hypothetical protein
METQFDIQPVYQKGWTEERKLLLKLVAIYKVVKYIQKRGKNKFHNYSYATEADVNEKVREELAERNVILIPNLINHSMRETTTRSGNTEYICCVIMQFTFMDAETGEQLTIGMRGEGQDVGDKAIFKAISGCQKYALMKQFMIPTGDDPEADEDADRRNAGVSGSQNQGGSNAPSGNSQPPAGNSGAPAANPNLVTDGQVKMLNAKAGSAGYKKTDKDQLMKDIGQLIGATISSFSEVQKKDVNKIAEWLDQKAAQPA